MHLSILRCYLGQCISGYFSLLLMLGLLLTIASKADATSLPTDNIQYEKTTLQEPPYLEVQRLIEEAVELENQGTQKAQQKAGENYKQALRLWEKIDEKVVPPNLLRKLRLAEVEVPFTVERESLSIFKAFGDTDRRCIIEV